MTTDAVFTRHFESEDNYDEICRRSDEIRRELNQRTPPPLGLMDTLLYMSKTQRKYKRTVFHITPGTIFFTLTVLIFLLLAATFGVGFLIWVGVGFFSHWSQMGWNIVSAAGLLGVLSIGVIALAEDKLGLELFWGRESGAGWSCQSASQAESLPANWSEIIATLKQQFPEVNLHVDYLHVYGSPEEDYKDMFLSVNLPDDGEDVYLEHFVKD